MAGPWEKYRTGGVVASIPGSGPKPPQGFKRVGDGLAAETGGPADPATAARLAAAEAQARAQAALPATMAEIAARTAAAVREAEEKKKIENAPKPLTPEDLRRVRIDALDKIALARRLREKSRDGWFATGFGAEIASKIGGTPAKSVQVGTETLKAGGALADILKLSQNNGGKNPFTPMSNADVELIARNTANLDIGQSDEDFQRAVTQYEDAYTRGFRGASDAGQDLEQGLKWREREMAKRMGAKPAAKQGWTVKRVN